MAFKMKGSPMEHNFPFFGKRKKRKKLMEAAAAGLGAVAGANVPTNNKDKKTGTLKK